jgi:hypothetical protein
MHAQQGILMYDLADPDARADHLRAVRANDMALSLWEIQQDVVRAATKYGEFETVEEVIESIRRIFEDRDIYGLLGD